MRRMVGFVAAGFAALGLWTASAQAAGTFHPRVGGALGLVPSHAAQDIATGAPIDAVYHGGPVMSGGVTLHTIFWAPPGYTFDSGYEALLKKFLTDSAAESGGTTNMYSVLTQYGLQTGPDTATAGSYSMSYSASTDSMDVSTPYPPVADQCSSPNGVTTCVTDGQIQAEIDAVAPTNERGLHNIWFVVLPPNVDECITAGVCGSNAFAGYHSLMDLAGGLTIYSVIINPLIEVVLGPGSDPQGDPNAEASADTIAHETTEAITDPEGTGWMDPNGFEVGDKCEFGPQVGTPLGTASDGSPFDELINGDQYLIQEMWSNADGGCVQRTTQTTSPLPLPQINLTQYGSTVTGDIGSMTSGVGVSVALYRAEPQDSTGVAQLAQESTTTDAAGNWSVSLAPFAVGDDRDVIVVTYSGSPLQPDVIATGSGGNPFTESGFTGWFDLDTGFDVSNQSGGFVTLGPCFQTGVLSFKIGASPFAATPNCNTQTDVATVPTGAIPATGTVTVSSNDNRAFLQPTPVTPFPLAPQGNEAGALVDLTMTTGEPDAFSAFASPIAAVLPLGAPTGFPSCTADLQAGTATCTGLVPGGSYTVTRARGGDQLDGAADGTGTVSVGPFAGGHPLQGGDVLALSNGTTTLTTLRVAALVAKISGDQTALGAGSTCQAGRVLRTAAQHQPDQQRRRPHWGGWGDADRRDLPGERVGGWASHQLDRADRRRERRADPDGGGEYREHLAARWRDRVRAVPRARAGGAPGPEQLGDAERLPRIGDHHQGQRQPRGVLGGKRQHRRRITGERSRPRRLRRGLDLDRLQRRQPHADHAVRRGGWQRCPRAARACWASRSARYRQGQGLGDLYHDESRQDRLRGRVLAER